MFKNYFKIAWRNILKTKGFSAVNILGLSVGLAVVLVIALWISDELSFNTSIPGYRQIVSVLQNQTNNGITTTQESVPCVLADELRKSYGDNFKYIAQASWNYEHLLTYGKKYFNKEGSYAQQELLDIVSLEMIAGRREAIDDPYTIIISSSLAKTMFGSRDLMNKILKIDNTHDVKIGGVYKDLPLNSDFGTNQLFLSWKLFWIENDWLNDGNPWTSNFTRTYAMLNEDADMTVISQNIKNTIYDNGDKGDKIAKPEIFLYPMSKWHLYQNFENGKNAGGKIKFVWLFGLIGLFVLALACINFINLATAQSEKRAKETGILKTLGSVRRQLIFQYLMQSFIVVLFALVFAIIIAHLLLPYFNQIAGKEIILPWKSVSFWLLLILSGSIISIMAGSYPAFFFSSFSPVEAMKSMATTGKGGFSLRKSLIVFQFTISIALLACTWIVYEQIQFAKQRSAGFNKNALITTGFYGGIYTSFDAFSNELKSSGAVIELAQSTSPASEVWRTNSNFSWKGKDPGFAVDFPSNAVSHDFGKTIGWKVIQGRDFSKDILSDSSAMIVTKKMLEYLDMKEPIGETITLNDVPYHLVGVVDNIIVGSPYEADRPCAFRIAREQENVITLRLNDKIHVGECLRKIETVYKKYASDVPFDYSFVDSEFAKKFGDEERIGKISSLFTGMAIFISILGLLGLAAFTVEKRTKEIGIRKVLGATMFNIWQLIAKEFLLLTFISFLIAIPLSWLFMKNWLQNFQYRVSISLTMYAVIGSIVILLTLLTVGFQAIRAAVANPVKSLRTE